MDVSMTLAEREAVAAMQAAAQALTRAVELAERAEYGTQIMQALAEAKSQTNFAIETAHGQN